MHTSIWVQTLLIPWHPSIYLYPILKEIWRTKDTVSLQLVIIICFKSTRLGPVESKCLCSCWDGNTEVQVDLRRSVVKGKSENRCPSFVQLGIQLSSRMFQYFNCKVLGSLRNKAYWIQVDPFLCNRTSTWHLSINVWLAIIDTIKLVGSNMVFKNLIKCVLWISCTNYSLREAMISDFDNITCLRKLS